MLAAVVLPLIVSCAAISGDLYYSAEPIEAWVVDEKTGKPLEGVVVVAHWQLMGGSAGGRVPVGSMMVLEATTDAKGRFSFPAWGPLQNTSDGHLDHEDPRFYFFKPGYHRLGLSNHYGIRRSEKSSKRKSEWSGKTIKLLPFPGTMEEYVSHVNSWSNSIASNLASYPAMSDHRCMAAKAPLIAEAFDRESRNLIARGYRKERFSFWLESLAGCGVAIPQRGGIKNDVEAMGDRLHDPDSCG